MTLRRIIFFGLLASGIVFNLSEVSRVHAQTRPDNPVLTRLPEAISGAMENTPFVFNNQRMMVLDTRPMSAPDEDCYLYLRNLETGVKGEPFGRSHSFVSAFVDGAMLNVFATRFTGIHPGSMHMLDINRYTTIDLVHWSEPQTAIVSPGGDQQFFNSSVCKGKNGKYIMAYETSKPVTWSFRFAESTDLSHWTPIPGLVFADRKDKAQCDCPMIRYCGGFYYVMYGAPTYAGVGRFYERQFPETSYITLLARSKDLEHWELSPTKNPMIDIGPEDKNGGRLGISATDADLYEVNGRTYIYYAAGNQWDWCDLHILEYDGAMQQMFEAYFPAGVKTMKFDARKGEYDYNFTDPLLASESNTAVPVSTRGILGMMHRCLRKAKCRCGK